MFLSWDAYWALVLCNFCKFVPVYLSDFVQLTLNGWLTNSIQPVSTLYCDIPVVKVMCSYRHTVVMGTLLMHHLTLHRRVTFPPKCNFFMTSRRRWNTKITAKHTGTDTHTRTLRQVTPPFSRWCHYVTIWKKHWADKHKPPIITLSQWIVAAVWHAKF